MDKQYKTPWLCRPMKTNTILIKMDWLDLLDFLRSLSFKSRHWTSIQDLPRQPAWWEHESAKCFVWVIWSWFVGFWYALFWEIETRWFVEFWLRPLWNSLFLLAMQLHLSDFVRNPKENLMAFFPLKTSWLWKPCVLLRAGQGCGTEGS